MKVIQNINNNVAICLDSKGIEVVAIGKGIGFGKPPYEVELAKIQKVFYGVEERYISMLNEISEEVVDVATKIVNRAAGKLSYPIGTNVIFTLADHIHFAIKRDREKMNVNLPILHDIQHMFEEEVEIGEYAVKLIRRDLGINLPESEECYIALHIINSKTKTTNETKEQQDEEIIDHITNIVERSFSILINRRDSIYSRFVSHMHYLLMRSKKKEIIESENSRLFNSLVETYPETFLCTQKISDYFFEKLQITLSDEEKMYLMIHINRLCTREDCNR